MDSKTSGDIHSSEKRGDSRLRIHAVVGIDICHNGLYFEAQTCSHLVEFVCDHAELFVLDTTAFWDSVWAEGICS